MGHILAIFFTLFSVGSKSVHLSERLATLIMTSEEHWKNDEISFQNVYGQMEQLNVRIRGLLITHRVFTFCFMGTIA